MIAIDKPRAYKVWPKGEIVKGREYYKINYEEEQLDFASEFERR